MQLLDANVIIRYILNDHPTHSIKARNIIQKEQIYIDPVVVAEVIWVFTSFYKLEKLKYIPPLVAIIDQKNNRSSDKNLIINTINFYSTHNLSYIDCYLYCLSQSKKLSLATFDTKLAKLV